MPASTANGKSNSANLDNNTNLPRMLRPLARNILPSEFVLLSIHHRHLPLHQQTFNILTHRAKLTIGLAPSAVLFAPMLTLLFGPRLLSVCPGLYVNTFHPTPQR